MLDILVANLTKNFIPIFFLSSYLSCGHIIIDATSCATVTPSLSAFTLPFCHVLLTYFISENYVKTSISTFLSKTTAHNFPHFLFLFRITYIFLMLSARSLIPAAAWSRYISANIFPLLISIYILLVKTQLQIFFSFFLFQCMTMKFWVTDDTQLLNGNIHVSSNRKLQEKGIKYMLIWLHKVRYIWDSN